MKHGLFSYIFVDVFSDFVLFLKEDFDRIKTKSQRVTTLMNLCSECKLWLHVRNHSVVRVTNAQRVITTVKSKPVFPAWLRGFMYSLGTLKPATRYTQNPYLSACPPPLVNCWSMDSNQRLLFCAFLHPLQMAQCTKEKSIIFFWVQGQLPVAEQRIFSSFQAHRTMKPQSTI